MSVSMFSGRTAEDDENAGKDYEGRLRRQPVLYRAPETKGLCASVYCASVPVHLPVQSRTVLPEPVCLNTLKSVISKADGNLSVHVYPKGPNDIVVGLNQRGRLLLFGCRKVTPQYTQSFRDRVPRSPVFYLYPYIPQAFEFHPVPEDHRSPKNIAIGTRYLLPGDFKTDCSAAHITCPVPDLSSEGLVKFVVKPEILSFMQLLFSNIFSFSERSAIHTMQPIGNVMSMTVHSSVEKQLCCCSRPCEMPSSLSVVDAIKEEVPYDESEVLSSGDEIDKFESDTDSQDTVIEGEAYKRMRSVAIKEKILHANEELFGHPVSTELQNPLSYGNITERKTFIDSRNYYPVPKTCDLIAVQESEKAAGKFAYYTHSETESCAGLTETFDRDEESVFSESSTLARSILHEIGKLGQKESLSVTEALSVSCNGESLVSSESSDNGSDVEEVILSDTSTSSDEATYISPGAASYNCRNMSVSYRLHTIMEESCEDSDRGSNVCTPSSNVIHLKLNNSSRKTSNNQLCHKLKSVRNSHDHFSNITSDEQFYTASEKDSHSNEVLSAARLGNFFACRSAVKQNYCADDDLTDESGGLSSDDDHDSVSSSKSEYSQGVVCSVPNSSSNRRGDQFSSGTVETARHKRHDKHSSSRRTDIRNITTVQPSSLNSSPKPALGLGSEQDCMGTPRHSAAASPKLDNCLNKSKHSSEKNNSEHEPDVESISDDEARYILSHVMQHITNSTEPPCTLPPEPQTSPTLKMLESKITRLMLTVSPVSLSAGEPSSSCSSTIGSNNSDYGSDTLESCEDTTTDEESLESGCNEVPSLSNSISGQDSLPTCAKNEHVSEHVPEACAQQNATVGESSITDETLYICKQLVASLKKIADSSEANMVSDELSKAENDDSAAKQYIADQIVCLMQTVNASQTNSPSVGRFTSSQLGLLGIDVLSNHDRSDSDSPQPNEDKRCFLKSKTPSESGSETTISASISIPSYDDSDRTPTESEISHEMDELYALLESNGSNPETANLVKSSFESEGQGFNSSAYAVSASPDSLFREPESSLLFGAANKLESLLPISIEERIAMYSDALINRERCDTKEDFKLCESAISSQDILATESRFCSTSDPPDQTPQLCLKWSSGKFTFTSLTEQHTSQPFEELTVTSVKVVPDSSYASSTCYQELNKEPSSLQLDSLASGIDGSELSGSDDQCLKDDTEYSFSSLQSTAERSDIVSPLPKVINPKEKASSENDLLIANFQAKNKGSKVFGTKSTGNISELENISGKSNFRDTGYYSFKSSDESFLSLDDSTASRTSTTSLTQYRSLTSTETIPEEDETSSKAASPTKISLSSGNIPLEVCDNSSSKSSTLPPTLRGKVSAVHNSGHRSRSSFFSTSGVLRKLTLLKDESGNSLRSSPHGRMRTRYRTLSGGSEDGRQSKEPLPQISVSTCSQQNQSESNLSSVDKDDHSQQDEEADQVFSYHSRSQISLSSFGGRSGSVTSVYSAAGGGRYGTVSITGEVLFGLNYNFKAGVFEVFIKECRNLAAVDVKRNRSDPYVKVYLLPDRTKSGKRKTKVRKHTLNPVFDELLKFQVTITELERRTLWLSVWHSDRFGRNDFLGEVVLPLGQDGFEKLEPKWHPLQERLETPDVPLSYKGDLILALKYVPPDVMSHRNQKKLGEQPKGALHVLVKEARNLMATRSNGTSDPFCKSYLLPDKSKSGKQKTTVLKKTCNPKWNHTFVYENVTLEELKSRCLELTIWDYDKITSNEFLGGVRLCLGTGKYMGRDVDWMDSAGEEVSLWYTMLDRPNMWVDGSLLLRPSMQNRKTST